MKQATYNKDKQAWKRLPLAEILLCTIAGIGLVLWVVFIPPGWWL
jgi:hypothetical protein